MAKAPSRVSRERLEQLLAGMRGRRIAIVGDVMLDRYLIGDTERISPEAPVPVVTVSDRRVALGGAANVAANVAALGAEGLLVGVVGTDRDAEALREAMTAAGVSDRYLVPAADRPTTCKTRVLARGQQVVRIDEERDGPISAALEAAVAGRLEAAIGAADALLLEDYDKGVLTPPVIRAAMAAAKRKGIPTVVDPKFRSFFEYRGATVFKPNRRELANALPGIDLGSARELEEAVGRLGVEHLLLTLGAGGMVVVGGSVRPPHLIASIAREVFDVSGAGDTVTAWVGAALAAGAPVVDAAEVANLAASVEVAKAGVATVSPEEVVAARG